MAITYCIMCNLTGEKYYGSTIQPLKARIRGHRRKNNQTYSKQIIERGDYDAYVLGTYETKEEALLKEDWYIRNKVCLNKQSALQSKEQKQEYNKKWNEKNKEKQNKNAKEYYKKTKEHKREYNKEYNEKNREEINRKRREKYKMSK